MTEYLLKDVFEKPINGEWGKEVEEGQEGVKVIRTTNFTHNGKLDLSNVAIRNIDTEKYANKRLLNGDIIIEKSGGSPKQPVGRTVLFSKNEGMFFCNNFTSILRPKNDFYSKYLVYLLKNLYNYRTVLKYQNKTTGIINLKLNDYLKGTKVNIPPLQTQKKIAQTLDKAQLLIDKRKEQIEACDELIKSLFYEMFGDITKAFDNTMKLDNLINIVGGYAFNSKGYKEQGIPIVKIGTVNKGYLDVRTITYWDDLDNLGKYELFAGDLLITLTGTVGKDDYGNVLILPDTYTKYYLNQRVAKLEIIDESCLNKVFLLYLLKQPRVKHNLIGISRGVRQANISNKDIYSLRVNIPPLHLQTKFATQVQKIEHQKSLLQESLKDLETNFDALMQKAFKGELF